MIYAAYNNQGQITGFYNTDVHQPDQIPAQSIEISDTEWLDCLDNPGLRAIDLTSKSIITVTPAPVSVATLRANACDQIDRAAGMQRGKYTTQVAGQNEVYQLKLNEAQAYQKDTAPAAVNYPHLNAEATQTNTPIATVAQNVITTYNQWVPISAKIEGYRLGGKQAVNAATDATSVQAALNTALANLEGC